MRQSMPHGAARIAGGHRRRRIPYGPRASRPARFPLAARATTADYAFSMSHSLPAAIAQEWEVVRGDVDLHDEVSVWCSELSPDGHRDGARHYRPGYPIGENILAPEQHELARDWAEAHPYGHRIILFCDAWRSYEAPLAGALVGALLRHEAEHARQHEKIGPRLWELDELLTHAMCVHVAGTSGGADLLTFRPVEQDANAAAAQYLRKRHQHAVEAILGGCFRHVARPQTPPQRYETLFARTVACLYQYRECCQHDALDVKLNTLCPHARGLWAALASVTVVAPPRPSQ